MTKKAKSSKVSIVVQKIGQIKAVARKNLTAINTAIANGNTALCLAVAKAAAMANADIPAKDYRKFKTALAAALRNDKNLTKLATVTQSAATWRVNCNLIAQSAVAMIANPETEYTQVRQANGGTVNSKAAATAGQCLINADNKPDARAANAKAKASEPRQPKLRGEHQAAEQAADDSVIRLSARRLGQAATGHMRVIGAIAAMLTEDTTPEPAAMLAALQDVLKTGETLAGELDRLIERSASQVIINLETAGKLRQLI